MSRADRLQHATTRAVVLLALAAAFPAVASACSFISVFTQRDPRAFDFVGRATADTVPIVTGHPAFSDRGGHSGDGRRGAIYGQRVRVDRLGRPARESLGADADVVILVPWDYSAGCAPVSWAGSSAWAPVDTVGLFRARLRPRAEWRDGVPVLDVVTAAHQPYVFARASEALRNSPVQQPPLSADELLTLLDLQPREPTEFDTLVERRWLAELAARPALRGRWPMTEFVGAARWNILHGRALAHPLPMRGRYVMTATFPDGSERRFILQSLRLPSSALDPNDVAWSSDEPVPPADPAGLNLGYHVALDTSELTPCQATPVYGGIGEITWAPAILADGTRAWDASMQIEFLSLVITEEEEQRRREGERRLEDERARERLARPEPSPYTYVPQYTLRFLERAGQMRLDGRFPLAGLGDVRVSGVRISMDARDEPQRCPAPLPT